nr:retrovirus-related Pol polyprotein from transposon TNT 1-94 [Tanacetum cinerariifolium]
MVRRRKRKNEEGEVVETGGEKGRVGVEGGGMRLLEGGKCQRRVVEILLEATPKAERRGRLIEIVLFIVDSGCSKHMTGNLKLLINFIEKFLGTVKFGNDQIAPILGYGDLGSKEDSCYEDRQGSESQDYEGVTIRVRFKIFNNFRIDNGKSVQMPSGEHFKMSLKDCSVRDCDVERMSKVPYLNTVGSLIYLTVCTRPDIAYAVSVVSRYLANPVKNHWEAVK